MSTGFYNVSRNSVFSAVFFRVVRKIESDWSKDPQQSNHVHPNKYSLGNSPRWRRPKKDRKLSNKNCFFEKASSVKLYLRNITVLIYLLKYMYLDYLP